MADCPEFVIWDLVKPGSKFCVQASATAAGAATASNDFNATMHIVPPNQGATLDWIKADLSPGPKSLTLEGGGYGARGTILSGPNGPTVTMQAWIEAPDGTKPFTCTWTNSTANEQFRMLISIAVVAA
jgi:hypothetical protein